MHQTLQLSIGGMTCGNCVRHVTEALRGVEGVQGADVNLETATARVVVDGVQRPALIAAVVDAGYSAD